MLGMADDRIARHLRFLAAEGMTCAGDDLDFQLSDAGLRPVDYLPVLNVDVVVSGHQQDR